MVLHLLGKKSWNVYNTANLERVRRDEAEALAREEAEEQRMQDEDAAQRTAILRGEKPVPLALPESESAAHEGDSARKRSRHADAGSEGRKRRRVRGEDDTDRDIRYAREDAETGGKAKAALLKRKEDDAPLLDHAGHLQLIPAPDEKDIRKAQKNAEVEAEKAKKRKREEDQITMKFSNAAGYNNGMQKPWYASNKLASVDKEDSKALVLADVQDKNVWGNEDPRRKDRERNRISSNDPFAAMQQAQRQLKQSETDKEKWNRQRMAELEELKRAEKLRKRERRHRRRSDDEESLNGFSLDAPSGRHGERHRKHHHRRRSRSRSKERSRRERGSHER